MGTCTRSFLLLHFNFAVFSARSLFVFILSEMRFQMVLWCCLVGLVEFIIIIVYKIDGLWCGCGVVLKKWRKGSDQMVPWGVRWWEARNFKCCIYCDTSLG